MTLLNKKTFLEKHSKKRICDLRRGSITISAAISIPLFIFAMLCLAYLLEINAIGVSLTAASYNGGKRASEDIVKYESFSSSELENIIVELVGAERISRSIIEGGQGGISASKSSYNEELEEMDVVVEYTMRLPIDTFGVLQIKREIEFRIKPWTGYVSLDPDNQDGTIVYVTETGTVYHANYSCTHLKLSIQFVSQSSLSDLRNQGGGIYKSCDKCVHGSGMAGVYITNHGGKYHNSLSCSGLKRTIRAVKKSEVPGLGGCSRCT